jgi:hypothetical protein
MAGAYVGSQPEAAATTLGKRGLTRTHRKARKRSMQNQQPPSPESLGFMISRAFAADRLPKCDPVSVETYDDEGTKEFFQGTHWQDHAGTDLEARVSCLTFFTPKAFCFFLPAFLVAAAKAPESWLASELASRLLPPKGDPSRPSYASWWCLLTLEQRRAVLAFLTLMQSRGELHAADLSRLEAALVG